MYPRRDGGRAGLVGQSDALHGAQADIDVFEGLLQALVGRIVQIDIESSQGKVERDAVAHETGPDDPDPRDVFGVHGYLLLWSGSISKPVLVVYSAVAWPSSPNQVRGRR